MRVELNGYNPDSLSDKLDGTKPADFEMKGLNEKLMNGFYGSIETNDSGVAELYLRDKTPKTVVEEIKTLVSNLLTKMDATEDQISAIKNSIQKVIEQSQKE